MTELTFKDRVLGGLWGAVVGDALGVPVELAAGVTRVQRGEHRVPIAHRLLKREPGTPPVSDLSGLLL
jgi:hypothetical protein